jgi:hypothetical protein
MRNGNWLGYSRFRNARNNGNAFIYPLWDDEPFWYGEPPEDESDALPAPRGRPMRPGRLRVAAAPEAPAPNPKVIELPATENSAASKPLPPATFILTSGERLEVRRYLLTHDTLYLTVDHQQRTIPIAMLDINATTAANHERGIEMRIPADHSEFSLSF